MTRIVAGRYRGRRLITPAGAATRPTSERVREAMFSRLDHLGVLIGARVLDLYCGSGALGLEAASRGAQSVVLVDAAKAATAAAGKNVAALGVCGVRVVTSDAARYLARLPAAAGVASSARRACARDRADPADPADPGGPGDGADWTGRVDRVDRAGGVARADSVDPGPPGAADGGFDVVLMDPPYELAEAELARQLEALAVPGRLAPGAVVVVERSSRAPEPTWPPGWAALTGKRYGETTVWFVSP